MGKNETSEWLKMLSRMIRAAGQRVADADEPELAQLVALRDQFDQAMKIAFQHSSKGKEFSPVIFFLDIISLVMY